MSACCGVKSVILNRRNDGSISITATGLKADVEAFLDEEIGGRITSIQKKQHIYTITKTDTSTADSYHRIQSSGIFKSVPKPIYDLYESDIVHKSLVPPTYDPDAEIYIRPTDDVYGAEGWTVKDILDELNLRVRIPSSLNYRVYEFNVRKGVPIVSLLQNLFPIPGLVVHNYNNYYYVSFPPGIPVPSNDLADMICSHEAHSVDTTTYGQLVVGMQGEPRYVIGLDGGTSDCGIDVTYNLVGGVFSVNKMTYSTVTEEQYVAAMYAD
jgi:hypothetical protein